MEAAPRARFSLGCWFSLTVLRNPSSQKQSRRGDYEAGSSCPLKHVLILYPGSRPELDLGPNGQILNYLGPREGGHCNHIAKDTVIISPVLSQKGFILVTVYLKKQDNTKTFQGLTAHRMWSDINNHGSSAALCMLLAPKQPVKLAKASTVLLLKVLFFLLPSLLPLNPIDTDPKYLPNRLPACTHPSQNLFCSAVLCIFMKYSLICANMKQANGLYEKWGLNKIKYDFYFKTFQFIKTKQQEEKVLNKHNFKINNFYRQWVTAQSWSRK